MQKRFFLNVTSSLAILGLLAFIYMAHRTVENLLPSIGKDSQDIRLLDGPSKLLNSEKLLQDSINDLGQTKLYLDEYIAKRNIEKELLDSDLSALIISRGNFEIEIQQLQQKLQELTLEFQDSSADLRDEAPRTREEEFAEEVKELKKINNKYELENQDLTHSLAELNLEIIELQKKYKLAANAEVLLSDKKEIRFEEAKKNFQIEMDKLVIENNNLLLNIQKLEKRRNIFEKENLNNNLAFIEYKRNLQKFNGLEVIFSGYMVYDANKQQIVLRTGKETEIQMLQDDFSGSLVGKCGLPVTETSGKRCAVTIVAEIIFNEKGFFVRGKEIVEVVK